MLDIILTSIHHFNDKNIRICIFSNENHAQSDLSLRRWFYGQGNMLRFVEQKARICTEVLTDPSLGRVFFMKHIFTLSCPFSSSIYGYKMSILGFEHARITFYGYAN